MKQPHPTIDLPASLIEYSLIRPTTFQGIDPAQTIVVLHEALGSVSQWGRFPQALADTCGLNVLVYSRPGHGASGPVGPPFKTDYLTLEATETLPAVLKALKITHPILFGHSDGATIALLYAGNFTEGACAPLATIVEAPHVTVEEMTVEALKRVAQPKIAETLIHRLRRHHDDPAGVFWRWQHIWTSNKFRLWDITRTVGALRCPLYLIQGDRDEYASLAQLDLIKTAVRADGHRDAPDNKIQELVIPNCGHTPHREVPEMILGKTKEYLKNLGLIR